MEQLAFLRAGIIASTIANCYRDSEVRREPFTPGDFMPGQRRPAQSTPEELLEKIRIINARLGGEEITNG